MINLSQQQKYTIFLRIHDGASRKLSHLLKIAVFYMQMKNLIYQELKLLNDIWSFYQDAIDFIYLVLILIKQYKSYSTINDYICPENK